MIKCKDLVIILVNKNLVTLVISVKISDKNNKNKVVEEIDIVLVHPLTPQLEQLMEEQKKQQQLKKHILMDLQKRILVHKDIE